ncbi:MAG: AMP-binding protein [Acidobacteriales bacterium]|nr:AMP-binding protein [Terriglobales bacterium]
MAGFYQRFLESVQRWPAHVAIELQRQQGEPERLTYSDLKSQAEAAGAWLEQSSSANFRGTRCAILADNGPRWVAAYLGAIAAGGVAVPFDTAFSAAQVAKLLRDSGSAFLFTDLRHLNTAQKAADEVRASGLATRVVLLDESKEASIPGWQQLAKGANGFVPANVSPEDLAVILYTSGTTSDPKGVMLTHDNLQGEADSVFKFLKVGPGDSVLGILPLFHALAQMANLLLPFAAGARVVYLETLNTTELLRGLRERQITLFACVPQFFYLIHERIMKQVASRPLLQRASFRFLKRLSAMLRPIGVNAGKLFFRPVHVLLGKRIRYLITGGSRFDQAIGRDFQHLGFNILQAYGLTETSGGASATPPRDNVVGSVGKPLPDVEMKIVPTQSAGDKQEGIGEVAIRGRIVMKGYYNRPDATAEVLKDGWLHTGDLGRFDERGNLFITGRQKEIIVLSSGKNIYPEEIEAHYQQSAFIKEMCVVGLESKPGEPFSERLHGVVVPNFDVLRERKVVNASQVIRFDIETLSAQLPSTKRILSYEIWQTDLPRTTTRKLKRFEIYKRVLEQQAAGQTSSPEQVGTRQVTADVQRWLDEPQHARALAVIRRAAKTKKDSIHPDDNLELDLGLDSMERVELLVELEREFDSQVPDSVVSNVYTVRDLVQAVMSGAGAGGGRARGPGWEAVLAQEVDDPDVLAVAQRRPLSEAFWFLASRVAYVMLRLFFRMSVRGREKLPRAGPFIISPNHQSYLDAPALATALPWKVMKDIFSVGTSEIFGAGLWRQIARWWRVVPVDPDANLVPAMRAGAFGLKQRKILLLFPEGERSIDGTPKTFRKGAGILAAHLKVPIVPVALEGFFKAWPRGRGFRRFAKLHIEFGDPITPPDVGKNMEELYQRTTSELRRRVVDMWSRMRGEEQVDTTSAAD